MEKKNILSICSVMFAFFIMGFCDIVGISSDYVQRTFNWSPFMTGFIPSLVFIWFLFLSIPVGSLMNKWGRKNTVLLSLVITIIGMFLPLVVYSSTSCVLAYIFLGIGNAILQVSLVPLLTNVITNKRLFTSALTGGQVFKAISSLVGPEFILFAVAMWGDEKWYYCFPLLGVVSIASALLLHFSSIQKEVQVKSDSMKSIAEGVALLGDKKILMLFLGIFFVVGVDVATNFVSSKIMTERFSWSAEMAKFAPQIYFLSRTIGAFLGAFMLSRIPEVKYFKINIWACMITLLIWALVNNEYVNVVCIGGVGFFASSIFAILYSLAMQHRPDKANQISGLMITAIAGGAVVTPVIGAITPMVGATAGIWVTMVCVAYLIYCAFMCGRTTSEVK